jgi:sigma-B regulation protein RsbU (phosphoserine phosphatase)
MRALVLWDNPEQAELLNLYLNVGDEPAQVTWSSDEFLAELEKGVWDVLLIATTHPDPDTAFATFQRIQELRPDTPVVGACHSEGVYRVARFLTSGLRSYVIRDQQGDYLFLLNAMLEGAVQQAAAERERQISEKLRREIESVRKLQESIIPQAIASPPGYQITARYESSQIRVFGGRPVTLAGGDYYDVFSLPDETLVLLVGDASGHGMKACMSIMTMHTLIRMIRQNDFNDPAYFVRLVNQQLCNQRIVNEDGGFITLLYGVLDPKKNEFTWASAGHPIPLLQNLETGEILGVGLDDDTGLPLGISEDAEYESRTTKIPPHSRLALFSDGLIEAFAGEDSMVQFGSEGVARTMRATSGKCMEDCLCQLFDDSAEFTQGFGRHDDTSLLILERNESQAEVQPQPKSLHHV